MQAENLSNTSVSEDWDWQQLSSDWERSEKTQEVFCAELGLNLSTFKRKRRHLKRGTDKQGPLKLIPLKQIIKPTEKPGVIELALPNGIVLRIPYGSA